MKILYRRSEVARRLGENRETFRLKVIDGKYPHTHELADGKPLWTEDEVSEFVSEKRENA